MIKIGRGPQPAILAGQGATLTALLHASVHANLANLISGKYKLTFDRSVYAHSSVKDELIRMQHDKCCFCESKITHICYGDVEHFRPKKGWRKNRSSKLNRPGYFWLAYSWENLFLCCQSCNQREKRNHFPLAREQDRCVYPATQTTGESQLFVHPCDDSPEQHIGFRGDMPFPIGKSKKGKATIKGLGLDRKSLQLRRAEKLGPLKMVYQIAIGVIPASATDVARANQLLTENANADSQYASAVRWAIQSAFQFVV